MFVTLSNSEEHAKQVSVLSLGSRVRELRKSIGLTQEQLAARVDIVPSYVSQIERGYTKLPGLTVLQSLARELGTTPDDLVSAAVGDEIPVTHLEPTVRLIVHFSRILPDEQQRAVLQMARALVEQSELQGQRFSTQRVLDVGLRSETRQTGQQEGTGTR